MKHLVNLWPLLFRFSGGKLAQSWRSEGNSLRLSAPDNGAKIERPQVGFENVAHEYSQFSLCATASRTNFLGKKGTVKVLNFHSVDWVKHPQSGLVLAFILAPSRVRWVLAAAWCGSICPCAGAFLCPGHALEQGGGLALLQLQAGFGRGGLGKTTFRMTLPEQHWCSKTCLAPGKQ